MKIARFLLGLLLVIPGCYSSDAAVRIAGDRGGRIGKYLDRYDAIRTSGETVISGSLSGGGMSIMFTIRMICC